MNAFKSKSGLREERWKGERMPTWRSRNRQSASQFGSEKGVELALSTIVVIVIVLLVAVVLIAFFLASTGKTVPIFSELLGNASDTIRETAPGVVGTPG